MRAHLLQEARKRWPKMIIIDVLEDYGKKQMEDREAKDKPVYQRLLEDLQKATTSCGISLNQTNRLSHQIAKPFKWWSDIHLCL